MAVGRFAPSPTGDLHLGNLRTGLLAWLFARSTGDRFLMRVEDLDQAVSDPSIERRQLADLAALGLDWDGEVVHQSDWRGRYEAAIARLADRDLTYPCYCSRREIRQAASAPHDGPVPDGVYPGTCRSLSAEQRAERKASGRPAALRLRGPEREVEVEDDLLGPVRGYVDDVVLRRNDGTPAYNLAVVVDDAAQGVEQVVRGDDLASSTPRQRHLASLLGLPEVRYAHVPLALGPEGERLAKRDGAVSLGDQQALGRSPAEVCGWLAASAGLLDHPEPVEAHDLISTFRPERIRPEPWRLEAALLAPHR